MLLKGRKLNNETKWLEESQIFANEILAGLNEHRLTIKSIGEFNDLAALLYSLHGSSLPSESSILALLNEQLHKTVGTSVLCM